ncbi:MAG: gliding motility-associated C-terminal domain-containing protein [Prevotellaceae bacterium]|jgi:gliding motility-associated-like protein|nr:gliding motility-associated C-terminal domain-containing protein [Prevotellaceae bacterium]
MKKILLFSLCLSFSGIISGQLTVFSPTASLALTTVPNLDGLYLFNGISTATEITYTGAYNTVEWRDFANVLYTNTPNMSPDDGSGYILVVDGVPQMYIWVIDYALYPVELTSLTPNTGGDDICSQLTLDVVMTAPELVYYDKNQVRHTLPRQFTLSYTDKTFASDAWTDSPETLTQTAPFTLLTVDAPFQDVEFVLTGDDIAQQMGLVPDTVSCLYSAVAVEVHPKGTIEERGGLNEIDRSSTTDISGSGPLVVKFESRANTPIAAFFEWYIYNVDHPDQFLRYIDENPRYTFQEYGRYVARLVVSSRGGCQHTDSLNINVLASMIDAPNVFTPNADGINDEFRVAYRSLKTFNCRIMNRWGRVVYTSSDPAKGWDGRINGKPASAGTYYYFIEATGTDKDSKGKYIAYKLKGDINLLIDK